VLDFGTDHRNHWLVSGIERSANSQRGTGSGGNDTELPCQSGMVTLSYNLHQQGQQRAGGGEVSTHARDRSEEVKPCSQRSQHVN